MLTKKQNLLETIRGGHPDRLVNQFEYMSLVFDPVTLAALGNCPKGGVGVNGWGVRIEFPDNVPGPFPNTSPEYVVIKDVTEWRKYVKAPATKVDEEAWAPFLGMAAAVDRNETFLGVFVAPGIFEKLHYLMGMEEAMINFYEEPEAMHELIDYLTDYELACAKEIIDHLHPDALFHHDDWGSQRSSFLSPEMFDEFIVPAYQKIYGFWKENGVEIIVHHSDSYAANLVPGMIKMGIDIWQGAMSTNDVPDLVQKYRGQIAFHGGVDNGKVDREDWTPEAIAAETRKAVEAVAATGSTLGFIPGTVMGEPGSVFKGVYDEVTKNVAILSDELFK